MKRIEAIHEFESDKYYYIYIQGLIKPLIKNGSEARKKFEFNMKFYGPVEQPSEDQIKEMCEE